MWIYSLLSNLIPGTSSSPEVSPPSKENPSPYQFPVLDEQSRSHHPLSFEETRPIGTYLNKRAVMHDPGQQQRERNKQAQTKIEQVSYQKPTPPDGSPPPPNVPRQPTARPLIGDQPQDGTFTRLETPNKVQINYLKTQMDVLCSEVDWQLRECMRGPGMMKVCLDERKRAERCKQHTRAFLLTAGFGAEGKTKEQDQLIMRECDIAFQKLVQEGKATELPISADVYHKSLPIELQ